MNISFTRSLLALILLLYFILAVLFAIFTPPWQAPDEPAHYNYVRYLAEHGRFPVLQMGDYPHAYLEEIKARKFPTGLSIDPIRYEFHQPPLYYALAASIYALTGGSLPALRLFSVLLGAGIAILAYIIVRRIFPDRPALALGTAAFVAFLLQHLATVSQVGNDVLAELLFAAALLEMVKWLEFGQNHAARSTQHAARSTHHALYLGLLLGLILLTKTSAYIAAPLAAGVLIWSWRRWRAGFRQIVAETAAVVIPAMLLALPWYIRNVAVYGWPDFFGLIRHDQIVVGQLRTVEYLAQYGWNSYLQRLVEFTFKSFWGVFGWLGVFMDSRVYMALAVLSGVVAGGLGLWMADGGWRMANGEWRASSHHAARTTQHAPRSTHYAARLLAISALLTFLSYAWYNIQFVQHQGRYLFTALIPIGLAFAIGWEAAVRPPNGRLLAAGLVLAGAGLVAWERLAGHGLPKWPLAIIALVAAGLVLADFGQRIPWAQAARSVGPGSAPRVTHHATRNTQHVIRAILFALPFALLPLLSFYALFKAIVPQLR